MSVNLIETENDIFISESSITLIRPERPSGLGRAIIETKDGRYVSKEDFSSVCKALDPIVPMIPAAPNWTLLQFLTDTGDVMLFPIIGWRYDNIRIWPIHLDRYLWEIVEVNVSKDWEEYVMSPTGQVVESSNRQWDNYDEWLADMKEKHKDTIIAS